MTPVKPATVSRMVSISRNTEASERLWMIRPSCSVIEQKLLLICQEALTNAVRHAAPRRVDVDLEYGGEELRVIVRDDGRGFDPHTVEKLVGHYGVISMRERAENLGGRLTIARSLSGGTEVEAVVPTSAAA